MQTVMMETTSDCFRACLASLLNTPLDLTIDVSRYSRPGTMLTPHALLLLQDWMLKRDAYPIFLPVLADDQDDLLEHIELRFPDIHVMISGLTRKGVIHAVIAIGHKIVHDPSPINQGELMPYPIPGGSVYQVFVVGKVV